LSPTALISAINTFSPQIGAGQVNFMRYFIKTFGCQMNVSDSERIAGFLEAYDLTPATSVEQADLAIFNTCGVRQSAEDRVYGQIHNIHKKYPKTKVVLTGCLANRKDVQRKLKNKVDLFFPISDFNKFENWIIGNCLEIGNWKLEIPARLTNVDCYNYLSIHPRYTNFHQAFVPVMTGCNNFCSYCVVPYARGREISRPTEEIIKEMDILAKNGCEEITLLGQNVNSYAYRGSTSLGRPGRERSNLQKDINFPSLLNLLASNHPKINFKFLTSHPKDFSDELIDIIARNKNICREIHLPVQSGSDKILKLMNRPYTQKYYLDLIKKARKKIPGVTFTTDVIVGFPGETEKYFLETVKVFKNVNYNEAYINKYSPRPGTAAWKLEDPIKLEEKKRREKTLRKLVKKNGKVK
jgi:tRNA-2-methylthio-N6-dimethylallyladenosine synthase